MFVRFLRFYVIYATFHLMIFGVEWELTAAGWIIARFIWNINLLELSQNLLQCTCQEKKKRCNLSSRYIWIIWPSTLTYEFQSVGLRLIFFHDTPTDYVSSENFFLFVYDDRASQQKGPSKMERA